MHENNFFLWNISEKTGYFNTGFVFYSVNIQPDIMKKMVEKYFWKSQIFLKGFLKLFFYYLFLY
jgi:hypothetical protein